MGKILALTVLTIAGCVFATCPGGWVQHEDYCYFISTDSLNWTSARDTCYLKGGYLAEPKCKDESDYLESVTAGHNKASYWIGGSDMANEGQWIWVHSNEKISSTYNHWKPGEPNDNGDVEDCLELYAYYFMQWNDDKCRGLRNYICEQRLSDLSLEPLVPINIG